MELGYLLVINSSTATVIIVDDKADCRLQIADILKSADYNTVTAIDGGTLLEIVKKEQFEIVFMDLRSSNNNDHGWTKGFRRQFGNQHLPIIAVTDLDTDQWRTPQDELKLWHALLKRPTDPELMYQIMTLMMDRHMAAV